jgi:hypothetical protein
MTRSTLAICLVIVGIVLCALWSASLVGGALMLIF